MAQPLSIEDAEATYLLTTRTAESRLWLINDAEMEDLILGILARYQSVHNVLLYAFILMGNHYHIVAKFPKMNRAAFMRDFNSATARLVGRRVKIHGRRSVWARRYAHQVLPRAEDVKHWFYYTVLNPVSSGITQTVAEYCTYNSFEDSANGIVRKYKYTDWYRYNDRKRHDPSVKIEQFTYEYSLTYSRLPGCESTPAKEYAEGLRTELLERQGVICVERKANGKGFLGMRGVRNTELGAKPKSTKTSTRSSKRPVCLTRCLETRNGYLDKYFATKRSYSLASKEYRAGNYAVEFPPGTYPPGRGVVRQSNDLTPTLLAA